MRMLLWIALGAFVAFVANLLVGRRSGQGMTTPVVAGAMGAAAAACLFGRSGGVDLAALWRVSTVFVGAVGIFVMANLSTGGRLR